MKYAGVTVRKNKQSGKWRAQLRCKEWHTPDGERFETEGEAVAHCAGAGLSGAPVAKWTYSVSMTLAAPGKREAKREAETWLAEKNAEAEAEARPAQRFNTVAEYVAFYIEGKKIGLAPITAAGYEQTLRVRMGGYPAARPIGTIPLDELTADDVQAWVNELAKVYSVESVRGDRFLLGAALSQAVQRGRLAKNPAEFVTIPKKGAANPNSLTEDSRARLVAYLAAAPATGLLTAVRIQLYLGLRVQEVCGLRWADVDLSAKMINVRNALGSDGHNHYFPKEPKNPTSARTVPFEDDIARALRSRRAEMEAECMGAGIPFSTDMYVCGDITGDFLNPRSYGKRFKKIVEELGLEGVTGKQPTPVTLRHTYATTATTAGVDIKSISSTMGHSATSTTMNLYASADPDAKRRAAQVVSNAYARLAAPAEVIPFKRTGTDDQAVAK